MPKLIEGEFGRNARNNSKYGFEKIADGNKYAFVRGEDYTCDDDQFRRAARTFGGNKGYSTVTVVLEDGSGIGVQFVKRDGWAPKKKAKKVVAADQGATPAPATEVPVAAG